MNFVNFLSGLKLLPEKKLLELYPPFFFMGVTVKSVAKDYRKLHLQLPQRWYSGNMHGTIFGGFICAVSDPLPVLLLARIIPGTQVWTKSQKVEFLKPGKGRLDLIVTISEDDVSQIKTALQSKGSSTHTFFYSFKDKRGRVVAEVANTVYIRKKEKASSSQLV
ncbi:MAG: PaaI family thioesterase [Bacteriovoracia bacterium]